MQLFAFCFATFCSCSRKFFVLNIMQFCLQQFDGVLQQFAVLLQATFCRLLQDIKKTAVQLFAVFVLMFQLLFCIPWHHSTICLESSGFIAQHSGIPRHHNTTKCGILWLHITKRVESHGFIAQQVRNTSQNPSEFVRVCERDTNRHTGVARYQMHFEAVVAS